MTETIREKVARLDALRRELRAESGRTEGDDYRLFPPVAASELRAFERRAGRAFPASYRAFLELANAWRGFMNGWTLLGLRRRDTELFFREGIDEKVLGALAELVPAAELKSLATREKTDPKVLSPRDHHVIGADGRGSVLVLDDMRASGGEPELALVKYIWVQKRWPSFAAMLDEAIQEATAELARAQGAKGTPASGKSTKGKTAKKAPKKTKGAKAPAVPKLRVVEVRPSAKKKPTKGKAAAPAKASKTPKPAPAKAAKTAKPAPAKGSAKKAAKKPAKKK